jgi:N-acetyltransferase
MPDNSMNVSPVTLDGMHVRLEPLAQEHAEDLFRSSLYPEIWQLLLTPGPKTVEEMRHSIDECMQSVAAGERVWFASVRKDDGCAVGMTSYLDLHLRDRGLEIGGTWLTPSAWRTPINSECKYLLLRHAFEVLGCLRVQLKTDERNVRSQRAIERLGAVKEGILRKYQMTHTGYARNTVMYSIVDQEWPQVKARLEQKMRGHQ